MIDTTPSRFDLPAGPSESAGLLGGGNLPATFALAMEPSALAESAIETPSTSVPAPVGGFLFTDPLPMDNYAVAAPPLPLLPPPTVPVPQAPVTTPPPDLPIRTTAAPTEVAPTTTVALTTAVSTTQPPTTVVVTSTVVGRTIVLSPNGSDSNPGTASAPRRTLPTLVPGDTILFRGGTYTGVRLDWTNVSGVTLTAYPGERPIFDGGYVIGEFAVLRDGVSNIRISGLQIQHYDDIYGNGSIVAVGNVSDIVIENNVFDANGTDLLRDHHIYLGGGSALGRLSNWTIRNNIFRNAAAGGIHSYGTDNAVNVVIDNNTFVGGRWGIILTNEGQQNWTIIRNTFSGARESGITLGYYARTTASLVSNIRISQNIIETPPGAYPLQVDEPQVNAASLIDDGNLYWNGGGPTIVWRYPTPQSSVLTLAQFRAASGTGQNSVEAQPGSAAANSAATWGAR